MDAAEAPMTVSARNPMLVIVQLLLPIFAANAVFRYLYTSSSTTYMHAFPLSRRTLFKGAFFSGLILSFAPVVLTMLTVLPCIYYNIFTKAAGAVVSKVSFSNGAFHFSNAYGILADFSGWFLFVCFGLLVLFFVYALAVFAAILTGSGSGQIAIAFVLNFVLFFVFIMAVGYMESFIIGFENATWTDTFLYLNPLVYITTATNNSDGVYLAALVIYLAAACLLVLAAGLLYKHRKLERAGSPICFSLAETAVTWLITLVGMAGMGIVFSLVMEGYAEYSKVGLVIGCVIGACLTFMVVTMLMQKTPRVFTLKNLKALGIYAIAGVLFVAFTAFDVTGFTDRVPNPERVGSVKLSFTSYPYQYPYDGGYSGIDSFDIEATSAYDLQAVSALYRGVTAAEKAYAKNERRISKISSDWVGRVAFSYKLGGAAKLNRNFSLRRDYSDDALREGLAGMAAFREGVTIDRLIGYGNISSVELYYIEARGEGGYYFNDRTAKDLDTMLAKLPDDKIRELVQCMDRDFMRLSAQELAGTVNPVPQELAAFTIEYSKPSDVSERGYYTRSFNYTVTSSYPETLDFLRRLPG